MAMMCGWETTGEIFTAKVIQIKILQTTTISISAL
jgi:hypothetical protein